MHVPKTETRTNDDDGPNENINRQSAEVCVRNYELEFIESETTCNDYFLTPVGSLLIIYRHSSAWPLGSLLCLSLDLVILLLKLMICSF